MRESHHIIAGQVGRRLKELRGPLTQAEFAAKLGQSQAQYSRYETGERLAPDKVLQAVAGLCSVEVEAVAFGPVQAPEPGEQVREVAELAGHLDAEGLEDLYFYLKSKVENIRQKRKKEARSLRGSLQGLKRKAKG